MSDYSKLNINREKIRTVLVDAFSEPCIQGPFEKGTTIQYLIAVDGQKTATLVLHLCSGGRTTINPSTGKNTPVAMQAADVIKARCIISDRKEQTLYIKSVPDEEYKFLLNHLRDVCGATLEVPEEKPFDVLQRVKGKHGDSIVIHKYQSGAVMIQGRPITLYCDVVEILTGLLPLKEIIAAQLKSFHVNVTTDEAVSELGHAIPTAIGFLPTTLQAILSPAITLRKIDVPLTDYSCFVFPAFRGLEGYAKQLFLSSGVQVGRDGFYELFDMTCEPPQVKPGTRFAMRKDLSSDILLNATCDAIVASYLFLKKHRHGLFHADGVPVMSRLIEHRAEADSLVAEVMELIETTYTPVHAAKT